MTGQNTAYPGPLPAPAVAAPPRSKFSKWWPISFFILTIVFCVIGGSLLGAWSGSTYDHCYESYRGYYRDSCVDVDGKFYGGIVCLGIAGICKLIAWALLIVYCIKRVRQPVIVTTYAYPPAAYAGPPVQPAAAPMPYQPYQSAPTPNPKEQAGMGMSHCNNCGAALTSPFCSQCGIRA